MGQPSFGLLEVRKGSQENKGLVTGHSDGRGEEGKKGNFNGSKELVTGDEEEKGKWQGLGFGETEYLGGRAEVGTWGRAGPRAGNYKSGPQGWVGGESKQGALDALESQLPFTLFLSAAK